MEAPNLLDMAQAVTVVSADDLVRTFSSYHISVDNPPLHRDMGTNSKQHQLTVEFPCFDLLPPGGALVLEDPVNICHRERPRKGKFFEHNHPDAMVRFETTASVSHSTIPTFEKKYQLEHMVERLSLAPGYSNLKIISFRLRGQVFYSFKLHTNWVTSQGQSPFSQEIQNHTAPEYEWHAIRDQGSSVFWVNLLESHMNRATDFSYLRVQERLMKHDARMARRDEDHYATMWDTQPLQSANNVLKLRFKRLENVEGRQLGEGHDLYELPCGHAFMCHDTYLMCVMTEQECKDAKCPECSYKILYKDDDQLRLMIVHDRRVREHCYKDDVKWEELKRDFLLDAQNQPRDGNAPFLVLCKDFRRALIDARKSFHLPTSAMPHEINFVNYVETRVIRDRIEKCLAKDFAPMIVEGEATMGLLIKFAGETLRQYAGASENQDVWTLLPPAYRRFLMNWFARTLYLAFSRYKQTEQEMESALLGKQVQEQDDTYRLGYKLDLSFMGKRRAETSNNHKMFGSKEKKDEAGATYVPEEGDWVRVEKRFVA